MYGEAGPTGFDLARFLAANGVAAWRGAVATAASQWDRVKTDARDAMHLARGCCDWERSSR